MKTPTQQKGLSASDTMPCSVFWMRKACKKFRKGSARLPRVYYGDCVVCGMKEEVAIHTGGEFRQGSPIPFHKYIKR